MVNPQTLTESEELLLEKITSVPIEKYTSAIKRQRISLWFCVITAIAEGLALVYLGSETEKVLIYPLPLLLGAVLASIYISFSKLAVVAKKLVMKRESGIGNQED